MSTAIAGQVPAICWQIRSDAVDMLDYRHLPDEALLRAKEIYRPGPYPGGHSSWWAAVGRGEASQPVKLSKGMTVFQWGQVREYLRKLAEGAE